MLLVGTYNTVLNIFVQGDDFCKVEVWYRSWIKDASGLVLTKIPECSKSPIRRPLLGRPSTRKVLGTSPAKEVADALNFAVCAVNTASNDMFLSVLGDSSGVTYTQQVTFVFQHAVQTAANCCCPVLHQ